MDPFTVPLQLAEEKKSPIYTIRAKIKLKLAVERLKALNDYSKAGATNRQRGNEKLSAENKFLYSLYEYYYYYYLGTAPSLVVCCSFCWKSANWQ